MNRMLAFASRCFKEVTRDFSTLIFGVGFPVVLITLMSVMKQNVIDMPAEMFAIGDFAPGMAVFGLSFLSLFTGMLLSGDRESSFLMRVFSSPLKARDYLLGYSLPLIPVALCQGVCCFATAFAFGLQVTPRVLLALVALLPAALLYIAIGLLVGSVCGYKQSSGVNSVVVNAAAWLSGTWFSLDAMGGGFRTVCNILPFARAVDVVKIALSGNGDALAPVLVTLAWAVAFFALAAALFRRKMRGE